MGVVGLSLAKTNARKLIKLCRQAPYGKGTKTVVDTDVRRVWELDPAQFQLTNPNGGNWSLQLLMTRYSTCFSQMRRLPSLRIPQNDATILTTTGQPFAVRHELNRCNVICMDFRKYSIDAVRRVHQMAPREFTQRVWTLLFILKNAMESLRIPNRYRTESSGAG